MYPPPPKNGLSPQIQLLNQNIGGITMRTKYIKDVTYCRIYIKYTHVAK